MSASLIVPNLWIGGQILPVMQNDYQGIVDCRLLEDVHIFPALRARPMFLWIPMIDGPELPALAKLEVAAELIDQCVINQDKCLVHCQEGKNRSALVIAYFLIKREAYAADDAIDLVRQKRGPDLASGEIPLSNQTFVAFLQSLSK